MACLRMCAEKPVLQCMLARRQDPSSVISSQRFDVRSICMYTVRFNIVNSSKRIISLVYHNGGVPPSLPLNSAIMLNYTTFESMRLLNAHNGHVGLYKRVSPADASMTR